MPLLSPSFETTFPRLKQFRSSPGLLGLGLGSGVSAEIAKLVQHLLAAWPFDEQWYLATYPDVAKAVSERKLKSGRDHYLSYGYYECRLPCQPNVDQSWYLTEYPDVAEAISTGRFKSATQHFVEVGYREGRSSSKLVAEKGKESEPAAEHDSEDEANLVPEPSEFQVRETVR